MGVRKAVLEHAIELLKKDFEPDSIVGVPGDVTDPQTHQDLWDMALCRIRPGGYLDQ